MTRLLDTLKSKYKDLSVIERLLFLICIICITIRSVYIFTGSIEYFTSDSAAYNILGREENLTGTLYPEDWNNATAMFGFGPNVLIWAFSNFITDQMVLKNLSFFIFYLFLIASIVYVSKAIFKNRSYLVAVPIISIGFSAVYSDMLLHIQYIVGGIVSVVLPSLFLSSFSENKTKRTVSLILFFVMYSLYAHNSVLILQQVTLPLIAAAILYVLLNSYKDKSIDFRKYKNMIIVTVGFGVLAMVNLLLYKKVFEPEELRHSYNSVITVFMQPNSVLNNISIFIQSVLHLFGFSYGENLLSFAGAAGLIKVLCAVLLLIYFPIRLVKKYREQSDKMQIFILYTLVHVGEIIVIASMGTIPDYIGGARYLITSACLLAVLGSNYIYNYILKETNVLSYASLIVCCGYLALGAFPLIQASSNYKNILNSKKDISDFLCENDLVYGYASFWNAGNNSVLSDFKVQINPVIINDQAIDPYYWLCIGRYFDPETYSGESFLLLTKQEADSFVDSLEYKKLGTPDNILQHNGYVVYVYPYNISVNNFNGEGRIKLNEEISFKADENETGVLGMGWSHPEDWGVWSDGNENTMHFALPKDTSGTLSLNIDLYSYYEPRGVEVYINGNYLSTITVDVFSRTYALEIPEEYYRTADNSDIYKQITVKFTHSAEYSPHDYYPENPDTRKIGLGLTKLIVLQE
ncbi:MAG: hypothetical protein J1F03_03840 [Oscillospiraceae bacterium]|nr:hypothetical protein [Oscillospiraceae bacterium]